MNTKAMPMKTWLTLVSLFFVITLSSQTVTVSDALNIRNDQAYHIIGKKKDRFLLYRDKTNNEFEIQAFNEKLQLSWSKKLTFDRKKTDVLDVISHKDYFSVAYRFKQKGKVILKANKYDAGANLVDSATVYNFGNRFYLPKLRTVISEDRSKVLFYHIERQSKIEALCFDLNSMELLWREEFSPEGMVFHVDYQQAVITNDGVMYYILGKDNRKSVKEKHQYLIYHTGVGYSKGKINYFAISMKKMLTFDILFKYDNINSNLIGAGLSSDKNLGKASGFFFLKIPTNNVENHELVFNKFENKFVAEFLGKSVKASKGVTETIIQEIILRKDGGIIMIAERNKLLERQMATATRGGYLGNDGRGYIVDYYYDDLMAISIHPNGEVHWKNVLPKKQYSQDDSAIYSSFFVFKTPRSVRLIFNDEIKYENTVSEYVLQGNGQLDRNSVLSTSNQKLQLRFRDALQIASNELLIPSERRGKLRLVKVIY